MKEGRNEGRKEGRLMMMMMMMMMMMRKKKSQWWMEVVTLCAVQSGCGEGAEKKRDVVSVFRI